MWLAETIFVSVWKRSAFFALLKKKTKTPALSEGGK